MDSYNSTAARDRRIVACLVPVFIQVMEKIAYAVGCCCLGIVGMPVYTLILKIVGQ